MTPRTETLMPCPFCGAIPKLEERPVPAGEDRYWLISCPNENASEQCRSLWVGGVYEDLLIQSWNGRAAMQLPLSHTPSEQEDAALNAWLGALSFPTPWDDVLNKLHVMLKSTFIAGYRAGLLTSTKAGPLSDSATPE